MRLPPLSALRAFEAAARLRSFKRAAQELSVTPTAISHRIRVLEEYLGQPLFLRKVRAVEPNADGRALSSAVSAGLQDIAAAIERLRRPRRATVTLSATPAFATKWLVPRLGTFQHACPDIDLHVHASDEPVDLDAGTADLAVRYGQGPYPGAVTILLEDRFAAVASPALLATLPADALHWPLIHFDWHHPPAQELTWAAWAKASGRHPGELCADIRYSEESHAIQAAVAGQGVALLSLLLIEQELHLDLLRIVAGPILGGMRYHLLQPARRPSTDATRAVADWLTRNASVPTGPGS
ncbi:MAG: LysR substrate-binding domain-containing protein [Pseudomonas sp.]